MVWTSCKLFPLSCKYVTCCVKKQEKCICFVFLAKKNLNDNSSYFSLSENKKKYEACVSPYIEYSKYCLC